MTETNTSTCLGALLATLLGSGPAAMAGPAATLTEGHMDIGIVYEAGAWDLHVHKETPLPEEEFAPGEVLIRVGPTAALAGGVPASPAATAFFGAAGTPLWVLPVTQQAGLPFLGIGAEEMDPADWSSAITLSLDGVQGPGQIFVWDTGAFGELIPRMSSRDGIGAGDSLPVEVGSHAHYFWAFSAPGEYQVSLHASGIHRVDGPVTSDSATYHFEVVPEPGIAELLGLGGLLLLRTSGRRPS